MTFDNLPDDSKVWIYGFNNKLTSDEVNIVKERLQQFVDSWHVHNSQVAGGFIILEEQFVLIATNDKVSGCSIDSSVSVFKELHKSHGLNALDQNLIFYRDINNQVQALSRTAFREIVNQGMIKPDSKVFNLLLDSIGQLKENLFETDFSSSWHNKVFKMPQLV